MPAKKQITREAILNAAFEIVRKEGMDALNMRSIAKKCNCSTQPIYLSFRGIDELRSELGKMMVAAFDNCIEREMASGKYPEYKAVGMGYIRFAKEEKNLFKTMLMNEGGAKQVLGEDSFNKPIYLIMKNYGLYKEEPAKLHAEMWLFVHGIATMYATDFLDWDWETVSEMVTDAFYGLSGRLKGENK